MKNKSVSLVFSLRAFQQQQKGTFPPGKEIITKRFIQTRPETNLAQPPRNLRKEPTRRKRRAIKLKEIKGVPKNEERESNWWLSERSNHLATLEKKGVQVMDFETLKVTEKNHRAFPASLYHFDYTLRHYSTNRHCMHDWRKYPKR